MRTHSHTCNSARPSTSLRSARSSISRPNRFDADSVSGAGSQTGIVNGYPSRLPPRGLNVVDMKNKHEEHADRFSQIATDYDDK